MFRANRLEKLIERFLQVNGIAYFIEGPVWAFRLHVEELEQKAKDNFERSKVEAIMRQLLKSNVFKQV